MRDLYHGDSFGSASLYPDVVASAGPSFRSWSDAPEQPPQRAVQLAGNTVACVAAQAGSVDATSSRFFRLRMFLARIMDSVEFEWAASLLICMNTVLIGVEQSQRLAGHHWTILEVCEHLVLFCFGMEFVLRLFAFGPGCFRSGWIVFDFVLVSFGISVSWILPLFMDQVPRDLGIFVVFRCGRLLRLGRTLRILIHVKELWMLIRGLMASASTMVYTMLLLTVIIFMFSSLGIELITNNSNADPTDGDPEFRRVVEENFADLRLTMLTLIQFVTLDSVAAIYVPLVRTEPYLIIYFAALIIVVGVVLMNLITAVVVQSALEQAMQDKEMAALDFRRKKAQCIQNISALFRDMDTDNSGTISREELTTMMSGDSEDKQMMLQFLCMTEPEEIFDALDVSGDGEVSIDEFCDQLWLAFNHKGAIELTRTQKRTDSKLEHLKVMMEESIAQGQKRKARDAAGNPPRPVPCGATMAVPHGAQRRGHVDGAALGAPTGPSPHGHQENGVSAAPDPAEAMTPRSETEDRSENSKVPQIALPKVSTGTLPRPARDHAIINPEPFLQSAEVLGPAWASDMRQALINELQVTRQMLVQEVHHACQGVRGRTAPETPDEPRVHEGVRKGAPSDNHHRSAAKREKRIACALPRGGPQAPRARRAERPEGPGCVMGDVATKEPSVWRTFQSPSLPEPTTAAHSDVHDEAH